MSFSLPSLISTALAIYSIVKPSAAIPQSRTYVNENSSMIYDWNKITPSPDLRWIPCFDQYTCARLEVPLDYTNLSAGITVLAYIKLPAENETASTPNIQVNGGGPGVSGVFTIDEAGPALRSIFGSEYNLIGFDPRGINNSGPSIDCFPGNPEGKAAFEPNFIRVVDDKYEDSVRHFYQISNAYGKWCADVHRDGVGRYANTAAVAADMLNFAEKQNEAHGLKAEDAKVWYYGGSYGTILGTTFAALYPDRVGRAIIDSVVDTDEYYAGRWVALISDATKALEDFFNKCYEAGPDKCSFWDETPGKIEERTGKLIENIRLDPIPVSDKKLVPYPQLATYELLQYFITLQLYSQNNFPILAEGLRQLEDRNGSMLLATYLDFLANGFVKQMDTVFIACLDAAQRLDLSTVEKWQDYVEETVEVAKWNGNSFSALAGMCSKSRDILPPKSQLIDRPIGANQTSTPLFFVGNSIDPATAIKNTHKMSSRFPGTTVLEQRVTGHGFIGFPSKCTKSHVQAYLKDGTLPPKGTKCDVDVGSPFDQAD